MTFAEITTALTAQFPTAVLAQDDTVPQPWLQLEPELLPDVCLWLRDTPGMYFDHLACLSGVDLGPERGLVEVVYHVYALTQGHNLVLRVQAPRGTAQPTQDEDLPHIPSVQSIWRAADWHEREAYDLLGIYFTGHPDMRRMLMPADWPGHPLRKDYQEPEAYHGIQVGY